MSRETLDKIDEPRVHLNKYVKVTGGGGRGVLVGLRKHEGCVQFPGDDKNKRWHPLSKLAPDEVMNVARGVTSGNGRHATPPPPPPASVRVDHAAAQVPKETPAPPAPEAAAPTERKPMALGSAINDLVQLAAEIKAAESELAALRRERDEILARHELELAAHDNRIEAAERSHSELRAWVAEAKDSLNATLGI